MSIAGDNRELWPSNTIYKLDLRASNLNKHLIAQRGSRMEQSGDLLTPTSL